MYSLRWNNNWMSHMQTDCRFSVTKRNNFFPYFLIASLWESLLITSFHTLHLQVFSPPLVVMTLWVPRKPCHYPGECSSVGNMVFLCPVFIFYVLLTARSIKGSSGNLCRSTHNETGNCSAWGNIRKPSLHNWIIKSKCEHWFQWQKTKDYEIVWFFTSRIS